MTLRFYILLFGILFCQSVLAQTPAGILLQEVEISDKKLKNYSDSQNVQQLNDSIIRKSQPSLTNLLNFSTGIYFKENGLGMVSSPSFRGTTAQQTAVIWNGININSQLNGQTDFNTITTSDFNSISVRAGGGSSLYGTSAIGGRGCRERGSVAAPLPGAPQAAGHAHRSGAGARRSGAIRGRRNRRRAGAR